MSWTVVGSRDWLALVPAPALAALAGLGLGLSLIVAIGAQNTFVLRQGLLGRHLFAVVAVCVVSDVVLICAGVGGAGAVLSDRPSLTELVRIAGALFLAAYGLLAARRALRPGSLEADGLPEPKPLITTVATIAALTWLNPHVYLDTVVLLGSVSHGWAGREWWFALGAATASLVWFLALGYGARLLRPLFARPGAWRVLDALVAVVMLALAASLAWGV